MGAKVGAAVGAAVGGVECTGLAHKNKIAVTHSSIAISVHTTYLPEHPLVFVQCALPWLICTGILQHEVTRCTSVLSLSLSLSLSHMQSLLRYRLKMFQSRREKREKRAGEGGGGKNISAVRDEGASQ